MKTIVTTLFLTVASLWQAGLWQAHCTSKLEKPDNLAILLPFMADPQKGLFPEWL